MTNYQAIQSGSFTIIQGSLRSAVLMLTKHLGISCNMNKEKAHELAMGVVTVLKTEKPDFNAEDVIETVNKHLVEKAPAKKVATTKTKDQITAENSLTPEQLALAADESLNKNERIRQLLVQTDGKKLTAIANAIGGLGYQRVKNVKKAMNK